MSIMSSKVPVPAKSNIADFRWRSRLCADYLQMSVERGRGHTLDDTETVLGQFNLLETARHASPCRSCVATRVSEPQVRSTRVAFGHEPQ